MATATAGGIILNLYTLRELTGDQFSHVLDQNGFKRSSRSLFLPHHLPSEPGGPEFGAAATEPLTAARPRTVGPGLSPDSAAVVTADPYAARRPASPLQRPGFVRRATT